MQLRRLPETGGEWVLFPIELGKRERCAWPVALPEAKGLLLTVLDEQSGPSRIEAVRLDGSGRAVVASSGAYAKYSPSGHVLYVDRGTLFAVEFDIDTFKVKGPPRPVIRDVSYREPFWYAHFDIAADGTLVYLRSSLSRIEWLDGGDLRRTLLEEPGRYLSPRLSPDGRQLAYAVTDGSNYRLFLLDLQSGRRQRMGNETSNEGGPLWTRDGQSILVTVYGATALGWRKPGSTDAAKVLLRSRAIPWSFSPDGRRLAYYAMDEKNHFDLWTMPIASGPDGVTAGKPELFLQTPAVETYPAISPDGKWMAYNSNESGDFDVYVRAIPDNGTVVKVSSAGGRMALWSRTANEIFYTTNDHRVMVARYSIRNGEFVTGAPRPFSSQQLSSIGVIANYDLSADGKSVVALVPAVRSGQRERDHVSVVVNFFDELRRPPSN
jgi:serine/threonine-protein kinase